VLRVCQLARDRGIEPRESSLDDVVICAGFHGLHGCLLADRAGYDDERNILARFLEQTEGTTRIELRYRVI
jgi:hypothetical protein